MKKLLTLILSILTTCAIAQPKDADISQIKTKYLDIPYANSSQAQKLDIYLPESITKPVPVIIAIHGGAFKFGDKRDGQLTPMLAGLKRGYAVISVNYRLSGESLFPANIMDVKAAIRWVRANAATYNLNPNKLAVWGGSAGGNLAALAGLTNKISDLEDLSQGNAGVSSQVQAVVDWFGPTDFLRMDDQLRHSGTGKPDHNEANSPESLLMGQQITTIPEKVRLANPETYITPDDPAIFIQHGEIDPIVPVQQSIHFFEKLQVILGDKARIKILYGAGHGGPAFETNENLKEVFAFLDGVLK